MKFSLLPIRSKLNGIKSWHSGLVQVGQFFLVVTGVLLSGSAWASDWRYSVRYGVAPLIATEQVTEEKESVQTFNHGVDAHLLYFYRPQSAFYAGMSIMVDLDLAVANQWGGKIGHRSYFKGGGASDIIANQDVVISGQSKWGLYWGAEFRFIKYSIPKDQFDDFAGFFKEDIETSSFAGGGNFGADYHISQARAWNIELGINLAQFGYSAADQLKLTTPFYLFIGITQKI